ncbi:site-2 protease family protein [Neobacillus sp. OS1-32]|uniref:Site-2 protease family protein n=1 Tax=Neobacillus paridis TaxID=2803862 RepID=A0ABS1TPE6_9BACI|nr:MULTISPECIES: site-2 protease family protein [Neobacillus]MBL4953181.1 site-2 protease family protein [Neobacillus paridis]WML32508.1 site-2 protease family protein [Neobacillus sp. OS1-32]
MIPYVAITLVFAFTLHEFAHAYVAYKFGDMTAKKQGRLTLNPLQHLDPFGTILILIAGFGWARPVPVNRYFFKKPRLAGVLVSVAGPLANLLLACLGFIVWYGLNHFGINSSDNFYSFMQIFIRLNIVLFIFNLLPLPPLDGYRIVEDLVPNDTRAKMTQYEQYGILIFLILVLIPPLNSITIQPLFSIVIPWIWDVLNQFFYGLFF